MAGKEPPACWCLISQDLAARSSSGSMKMKPRDWAKDFNTNAVSLETVVATKDTQQPRVWAQEVMKKNVGD